MTMSFRRCDESKEIDSPSLPLRPDTQRGKKAAGKKWHSVQRHSEAAEASLFLQYLTSASRITGSIRDAADSHSLSFGEWLLVRVFLASQEFNKPAATEQHQEMFPESNVFTAHQQHLPADDFVSISWRHEFGTRFAPCGCYPASRNVLALDAVHPLTPGI